MNPFLADVIIAGVIGITVTVSVIAMAVAKIVSRKRGLGVESTERIEERLSRIERAIDAMANEVERIGEGQRFTSRLLADRETNRT